MDVTDATFEAEVLDRSTQVPVVVDLWAPWCGPCVQLGPIIEKVIEGTDGKVVLVKVNIDENPGVAQAFKVQSIPAVFALKDRKVVDHFIGAQGEAAVRAFVDALAPAPTEIELLVAKGDETSLRTVLDIEPGNEPAILGLAQLLIDAGGTDEALALLARLPETGEVARVAAAARLAASGVTDTEGVEEELSLLLDQVKNDDGARQRFVALLELLSPEDPLRARFRKALAARLF